MTLARCRRCRQEISSDHLNCPHCDARDPVDLSRSENWVYDGRQRQPDEIGPFRFLVGAALVFVLIASLVALLAVISGGTM